ncbi:hypothetical protein M5K25_015639 [Dendrobium thyrsiflorum]|uniref:Uncharacterized protein n=1 Tax=Dendrobium thyrsiflorum TaxID=117978 RepID=A0ABD0UY84_DENTH
MKKKQRRLAVCRVYSVKSSIVHAPKLSALAFVEGTTYHDEPRYADSVEGWVTPDFTSSLVSPSEEQTWYFTSPEGSKKISASSSLSAVRLCKLDCLLSTNILLIVLLQHGLCSLVVGPNCGRLPTTVITTGITHVELEAKVGVPARKEEGDAKRAEATKLGVALFGVAEGLHELFDWHGLLICKCVALGLDAGSVDKDVGVRHDAGDSTCQMVVDLVHFLGGFRGLEELRGYLLLSNEDDAVCGKYTDSRAGVADGLHCILHLGESYLHSERASVVASDQNVVTSDPTGRERCRRSEVEQPGREPKKNSNE